MKAPIPRSREVLVSHADAGPTILILVAAFRGRCLTAAAALPLR